MNSQNQGQPGSPNQGSGNSGKEQKPNNQPSRPKDPNNDPDQTPTREVQNPPKAPGQKGTGGGSQGTKS